MRSIYKILNQEGLYFVTSTIIEWLPVFKNEFYYNILLEAIKYSQIKKNLKLYAYVLLDNHFHLIVTGDNLTNVFKSIKGFTAKEIIKQLKSDQNEEFLELFRINKLKHKVKSEFQVWQESFHPQEILTENIFQQKIDYIHMNPVRRGLVKEPKEWKYSSAEYFAAGIEGVLHLNGLD